MKKSMALIALSLLSVGAFAQFSEDFEGYGTGALNSGGWGGWDNDPTVLGNIVSSPTHGGNRAVSISTPGTTVYTDCVHPFTGMTSGKWVFRCWAHVATGALTGDSYMILMNNYTGTGVGYEWSVQMQFNGLTGLVKDFDVAAANQQNRNVVFDQWVPIHVYIDLANGVASATENGQAIPFYNNQRLDIATLDRPWRFQTTAGTLKIHNIDLYTDNFSGASTMTYDDIKIFSNVFTANANSVTTVSGFETGGDLASLTTSDDNAYSAFPDDTTLQCVIEVTGNAGVPEMKELAFNLEHSVGRPGLSYQVKMFRYSTGTYVDKAGGAAPTADTVTTSLVNVGANDYHSNGAVKASVTYQPINDEDPSQDGWPHMLDVANWTVTAF